MAMGPKFSFRFIFMLAFLLGLLSFKILEKNDKECVSNDDYCDCGDDESVTSACSMFSSKLFTCSDKKFVTQEFPKSRIGDRICDCCDGSDEVIGSCPNTCEQIAVAEKEEMLARESLRQKGLQKKEAELRKHAAYLNIIREREAKSSTTIPETEKLINKLKLDLEEEEKLEKIDVENMISQAYDEYGEKFYSANKNGIKLDRNNLINVIASMVLLSGEVAVDLVLKHSKSLYDSLKIQPDETEALYLCMQNMITTKTSSITVSNDGSTSTSTSTSENNILNKNIPLMIKALILDKFDDNSLKIIFPNIILCAVNKGVLTKSYEDAGINENYIPEYIPESPENISKKEYKRLSKIELQYKIKNLEDNFIKLRQASIDAKKILKFDFGTNDVLFSLWNSCYEGRDKSYKYRICPFAEARQEDRTILGHYEKFTNKSGTIRLKFNKGDRCLTLPQKPHRTMSVKLQCSTNTQLHDIMEPSICEYTAILETPIACF
eukprot:gene12917-27245_t